MNTTTSTHNNPDLEGRYEAIEVLTECRFAPLEDAFTLTAEYALTPRQAKVLTYFGERGWTAFRLEDDSAIDGWATLATIDEGAVKLMTINANGVIDTEARFAITVRGLTWLAAAVTA